MKDCASVPIQWKKKESACTENQKKYFKRKLCNFCNYNQQAGTAKKKCLIHIQEEEDNVTSH